MSALNEKLLKITKRVRRMSQLGAVAFAMLSTPASAYQVDCAILLCLSGGWPASAPCAHAKAVFIRRITPWPVEPPLQIWRCPMRAALNSDPKATPGERLYRFAFAGAPAQSVPGTPFSEQGAAIPAVLDRAGEGFEWARVFLQLAQSISAENGTADIDISGPEFDFVRSIKVWNVMRYSHLEYGEDDDCHEYSKITVGIYGEQGDFRWKRTGPDSVPTWVIPSRECGSRNSLRAVGIEWEDYQGNFGYEVVKY